MNSLYFETLKHNVNKIQKHFTQLYPESLSIFDSISIFSFILLVHAEIESYFENIAMCAVDTAFEDINSDLYNNGTCSLSSTFLFISLSRHFAPEIGKDITSSSKTLSSIRNKFEMQIDSNHGIKADNLERIFKPLGYSLKPKYNTLLSLLTAFGEKRGRCAHNSSIIKVHNDLATEFSDTDSLIAALEKFDEDFYTKTIAT